MNIKTKRENLRKLSAYLKSDLQASFDMHAFTEVGKYGLSSEFEGKMTNCGTVGCALGHGPYAGVSKDVTESWHDYAYSSFIRADDNSFMWLFDSYWTNHDNTALGAAKRIDYYLCYGIPDWFTKDLFIKNENHQNSGLFMNKYIDQVINAKHESFSARNWLDLLNPDGNDKYEYRDVLALLESTHRNTVHAAVGKCSDPLDRLNISRL